MTTGYRRDTPLQILVLATLLLPLAFQLCIAEARWAWQARHERAGTARADCFQPGQNHRLEQLVRHHLAGADPHSQSQDFFI